MCEPLDWRTSVRAPVLSRGTIHLWKLPLAPLPDRRRKEFRRWLNQDEQRRMDRLLAPDAARRFLIARAGLRSILARYLGISPASVVFDYGPAGKPSLAPPLAPLEFNLSHSGDLALLAVTVDQTLGIDLEQILPKRNLLAIARRMFPTQEYRQMQGLQAECRLRSFFRSWTAMEAQAKAGGRGLFESAPEQTSPVWELRHLTPAPGYLATLAARRLPRHSGAWCYLEADWENPA